MILRVLLSSVVLLSAGMSCTAKAGGFNDAWNVSGEDFCPPLMTAAECQVHHRILATLQDGEERMAYLGMHSQLLEDRRAACGCSRGNNALGMLDQ